MHRRSAPSWRAALTIALIAIGFVASCAGAWIVSGDFMQDRIVRFVRDEQRQAETDAQNIGAVLKLQLAEARSMPMILAQDPGIQSALARFGAGISASTLPIEDRVSVWGRDPALVAISNRLQGVVRAFNLNSAFITNAAGDTVAEGHNPGLNGFLGVNYADRRYFDEASRGFNSREFTIGRITNAYSLIYASPVYVHDEFMGIVGINFRLPKLTDTIDRVDVVVTDENGVVVMARENALLMQAVPGAEAFSLNVQAKNQRYKREDFSPLDYAQTATAAGHPIYRWRASSTPRVMALLPLSDVPMRVYVFRDLGEQIGMYERDRRWWFGLVTLTLLMLAIVIGSSLIYVGHIRSQRAVLARLNAELDRQANTDSLTGCANRRHFMHALETEIQRVARYGNGACMLGLDLDHFKKINDAFGHAAGDAVLKAFVEIVQRNLRRSDLMGRIGGEEFSVLLPETTRDGATVIAERIRVDVQRTAAEFDGQTIPYTVSIGAISWTRSDPASVSGLMALCDKALYEAKRGGRNRLVWEGNLP